MTNYIHYKEWGDITQLSMVVPLKFGNGYVISSHILLGMLLIIHDGIKINPL